jgi:hypothetical protein
MAQKRDTAFNRNISLNLYESPFVDFVKSIESQSNVHFRFKYKDVEQLNITLSMKNMPVHKILDQVFLSSNFYFTYLGNTVYISTGRALKLSLPDTSTQQDLGSNAVDEENYILSDANNNDENRWIRFGNENKNTGKVTIAGKIVDAQSKEPLIGAYINIESLKVNTFTDKNGFYSILIPKGKYVMQVSSVGMKETKRKIILNNNGNLDINMTYASVTLKKVTVNSQKTNSVKSTQLGMQRVDIKTIKQIPVAFGESDIFKALTTLPGVKSAGESSGGLNIRGGGNDQNLILLNEGTIYNPSHMFGLFSSVNPEIVKNVELYKGSVPAEFGGRLSSVIEINSKEGNKSKFEGNAGIGLLTSHFNIEGPLQKDKTSFIFGARSTYSKWMIQYLPQEYKKSSADYNDFNIGVTHSIDNNNTLYFNGYVSGDQFRLNSDTNYKYQNKNFSLKYNHLFSNKFTSSYIIGYDEYGYNVASLLKDVNSFELSYKMQQEYIRLKYSYTLSSKQKFDFGASTQQYNLAPGSYLPNSPTSNVKSTVINNEKAIESALYFTDNYTFNSKLKLDAGVRLNIYNYLGPQTIRNYNPNYPKEISNVLSETPYASGANIKTYFAPDIRLALRYAFDETFSMKLGYNSMSQFIHSISNSTIVSPTDIWKLSDPNIKPQHGDQLSFGLYKTVSQNEYELSIEGYYKNINNYLDYKSGAVLIMNPHLETDVYETKGKAYGVELYAKKNSGKLTGWISYTYARALFQFKDPLTGESINNGAEYPSNYDKPNDLTTILNYRITHRYSFSFNTTYSTGRPITLPVGVFYYSGGMRTLYADRNSSRIPDYFRADFSFNIQGNHKIRQKTHNSWSIGIYNLTGRKNPYSIYYLNEGGFINGYKLSIFGNMIPFINYNIRF